MLSNSLEKLSDAYFPMLVSETGGSVDVKVQMWMKFRTLSTEQKDILVSHELIEKIKEFESRFQLQEAGVAVVSLVIRKFFFGELDAAGAEAAIGSALARDGSGDPSQARTIVESIQKEVLTIKPAPEPEIKEEPFTPVRPVVKTIRLSLLKAMSEYTHLSEQMLTQEKIKLQGQAEPVRPTLGAWLKSVRDELGIGRHEDVERGRFLFQSQNGRKLSNEERARLNLVLKSVEEDFPLEIDPIRHMIVFPSPQDASMELAQMGTKSGAPVQATPMPRTLGQSPSFVGTAKPAFRTEPRGASTPAFQAFKPFFKAGAAPEKNVSGETLHFSTGHVLPAEHDAANAPASTALRPESTPTQGIKRGGGESSLPRSPYSIRPLRSRDDSNSVS